MFIVAWIACATALWGSAMYCQARCAQIEAAESGEPILQVFVGMAWWRGSTVESRQFRRLLVLCMVTGLLAFVHVFMLARGLA